jgi:hypothetical protein
VNTLKNFRVSLFLKKVCREIQLESIHSEIKSLLIDNISSMIDGYMLNGFDENEAIEKAINKMGSPIKIGKNYNKHYKNSKNLKMTIFRFIYNLRGIMIIVISTFIFTRILPIPLSYAVTVCAAVTGYATWLLYKDFVKLRYIVITVLVPAALFSYNPIKSMIIDFINPDGSRDHFLLAKFLPQLSMACVIIFAGFLVTLWLYSNNFKNKITTIIKNVTIFTLAIILIFVSINSLINRISLDNTAKNLFTNLNNELHSYNYSLDLYEKSGDISYLILMGDILNITAREIDEMSSQYCLTYGWISSQKSISFYDKMREYNYFITANDSSKSMPVKDKVALIKKYFNEHINLLKELENRKKQNYQGLIEFEQRAVLIYNKFSN